MNYVATPYEPPAEVLEIKMLAELLGDALRLEIEKNRWSLNLSPDEAIAKASRPLSPADKQKILDCPAPEVRWRDIQCLAAEDPEQALCRWEEIKKAAREHLHSGHRGAFVVRHAECDAWQLAEYLAIRHDLTEAWQPRNGVERQLIDQMTLAQSHILFWSGQVLDPHQNMDQAAAMVERFNKMFLRTVRAFADLRRQPVAVIVQNANQVNVGGQQVNVTSGPRGKTR
jgi:hypothetical protein